MPELSFDATAIFRDSLLARNLPPYSVPGALEATQPPLSYEHVQSEYSVVNQPDDLIWNNPYGTELGAVNKYGPPGGVGNQPVDLSSLTLGPNEGEYGDNPSTLFETSHALLQNIGSNNIYTDGEGYSSAYAATLNPLPLPPNWASSPYKSYWDPPSFKMSSYSPYDIFMGNVSSADISEDSVMAQKSSASFREMMRYRLQQNLMTETVGRLNFLDATLQPTEWIDIIDGTDPLIGSNSQITVPHSFIGKGAGFLASLQGLYYPASTIPGDFFTSPERNVEDKTAVGNIISTIGNFIGITRQQRSPSQLLIDNTGTGQKKQIAKLLKLNKFKPSYVTNSAQSPVGAVSRLLGVKFPKGNQYVGDEDDLMFLNSPPGQVPIGPDGREIDSIVYGPDTIAKEYEGEQNTLDNYGSIVDDMIWTSSAFSGNAGLRAGKGGEKGSKDVGFSHIEHNVENNKSSNKQFKEGSILHHTQQLINSQPKNYNRYSHVGNAIDQVSKIFNDGYVEMTKGSRVISYVTEGNVEKGVEYCRVFAKDLPYFTYSHLQKKDGNIRKFNGSVLDSTYNLNIVPFMDEDSTNIQRGGINGGNAKKYMFSIENLAWRTSSRSGYRVQDLPISERGPNGGRVMWFPPYGLDFSEDSRASFSEHVFLGRPEPVYTYRNTSRSGSLTWKIVVDHPSVLNAVVDKVLSNDMDRIRTNSILDSFISGCKKYDLYDLAAKYPNIPTSELERMQNTVNDPNSSFETLDGIYSELNGDSSEASGGPQSDGQLEGNLNTMFFYPTMGQATIDPNTSYLDYYSNYVSNISSYSTANQSAGPFIEVNVIPITGKMEKMASDIYGLLVNNPNGVIRLHFKGTPFMNASAAPGDDEDALNFPLTQDKVSTIRKYMNELTIPYDGGTVGLSDFISTGRLIFVAEKEMDEVVDAGEEFRCSNFPEGEGPSFNLTGLDTMACNSLRISRIESDNISSVPQVQTISPEEPVNNGMLKKILRNLLSEADYFSMVKEEDPFVYESLAQKLKYFQPAFHSTTPEGLNSRLTFLQQCLRPGETIPTIGIDGELRWDDALNTSFGAPPVLVLRVGDFFHTKIIPTNLSFKYENLDINPEGVGVQPMIANVTLSFNFIGGQGIQAPVERLQNALSFNFYGNTEMYDERAEETEDISNLTKVYMESLAGQTTEPTEATTTENEKPVNDGGDLIGSISFSEVTGTTEIGEITYIPLMNDFILASGNYFESAITVSESMISEMNYGLMAAIMTNRKCSEGTLASSQLSIIGRADDAPEEVDQLYTKHENAIKNGSNDIFTLLSDLEINDVRKFTNNYVSFIKGKKESTKVKMREITAPLYRTQEILIRMVNKLNHLTSYNADGRIVGQNNVRSYKLMANQDEYISLRDNINSMRLQIDAFHDSYVPFFHGLEGGNIPVLDDMDEYTKVEYVVISDNIIGDIEGFINIITSGCTDELRSIVHQHYNDILKPHYLIQKEQENTIILNMKGETTEFVDFTPVLLPMDHIVKYTTSEPSSNEKSSLLRLYDGENHGPDTTFNDKVNLTVRSNG